MTNVGLAAARSDRSVMFANDAIDQPREGENVAGPEQPKRVRVLRPFMVAHEGTKYFPDTIAEVPESLADNWIKNQWAESEAPVEKTIDPVPAKRGRRRSETPAL